MSTIVNLAERKQKKQFEATDTEVKAKEPTTEEDFKAIEERNKKNKERQEKDRQNANKSVKRSYRLESKGKK